MSGDFMERLQKVIAASGVASRRKAEELILKGCVTVNGEKVTELGTKVNGNDLICVNGKSITEEDKVYFINLEVLYLLLRMN